MDTCLLNDLIEAESLAKIVVDEENLEAYAQRVEQWQLSVELSVAQLSRPFSDVHVSAIEQLLKQSSVMSDILTQLKQQLHKDQQSLLKGNAAVHAYVSSAI